MLNIMKVYILIREKNSSSKYNIIIHDIYCMIHRESESVAPIVKYTVFKCMPFNNDYTEAALLWICSY